MRCALILSLLVQVAYGADFADLQKESVLRMQAAIGKQQEAARLQTGEGGATGFFRTPWLDAAAPVAEAEVVGDCQRLPEDQLRDLIADAARNEGVNPHLLRAVIRRESAFLPCAVSVKGAQGLMQLMPATQQTLGVTDGFDPAQNVAAGTRFLRDLLVRYRGDIRLALAAYNAGPGRVEPGGQIPNFPETRAYVSAILADLRKSEEPQP